MESTADRLRRFREAKGIDSGAELARLAGVPEATYRAYESGRRPLTARAAGRPPRGLRHADEGRAGATLRRD